MNIDPIFANLDNIQSVAFITLDSLRWDTFNSANKKNFNLPAFQQELRYSYASWTAPSHHCLLSGLLPYKHHPGKLASYTYKRDHALWAHILTGNENSVDGLYPEFCLPLMAQRNGWHTLGQVAMPVLNENTPFSRGFDEYSLLPQGGNFGSQIELISSDLAETKNFVFINVGETHYPYLMPKSKMPRISGYNGALKERMLADDANALFLLDDIPFSAEDMIELKNSQIKAVELVDSKLEYLLDILKKPLFVLIVSDHGELFGEDNFFGHGPFFHHFLFEVPLITGVIQ